MKTFMAAALVGWILLSSCSPVATSSPAPTIVSTETSWITFTPSPIPTFTSTPTPLMQISKRKVVRLNAMTDVPSPEGTLGVWMVGEDGFIAYQDSYGSPIYTESPERGHLNDVDFISADDGWIVGAGGLILHWGGTKWEISKPSISAQFAFYDLTQIAFTEATDGWAAGDVSNEGGSQFLIYHWDGATWTEVSLPEDWNLLGRIDHLVALSSTDVWVFGTNRKLETDTGVTIHWDGNQWKLFPELRSYNISSVSALSTDNIWAITQEGVVLNWDGVEWKEKTQLENANTIFAQAPADIFAVGTKIWYWNGDRWTDVSLANNFPEDAEIKDLLAPYKAESGLPDIWILDASGIIYTFDHPRTIRR